MAIYGKEISALDTTDIAELLKEGAVENIRLEFKKEIPGKDETLKKLSSFANTYGGYLIVGAEADNDGRLLALDGVLVESNYKQRIVQWCFDSLAPPVQPFVSDPIPAPGNSVQVVYVVYVEESAETPHFINSRKGCYIRTDEFSQRFEPRLATYDDIQHLANRRLGAEKRREGLYDRANQRFETYVRLDYQETPDIVGNIGATLKVAVSPRYPITPLVEQAALQTVIERSQLAFRGTRFPMHSHQGVHQFESIIFPNALGIFSMFDLSIWGQTFYAVELEEEVKEENKDARLGVRLLKFVSDLLLCIHHSRSILLNMGYMGSLQISVRLDRVLRIPFWRPRYRRMDYAPWITDPTSRFEAEIGFSNNTDTRELTANADAVARNLLRVALHAIDWPDAGSDDELNRLINAAYHYNHWQRPEE